MSGDTTDRRSESAAAKARHREQAFRIHRTVEAPDSVLLVDQYGEEHKPLGFIREKLCIFKFQGPGVPWPKGRRCLISRPFIRKDGENSEDLSWPGRGKSKTKDNPGIIMTNYRRSDKSLWSDNGYLYPALQDTTVMFYC